MGREARGARSTLGAKAVATGLLLLGLALSQSCTVDLGSIPLTGEPNSQFTLPDAGRDASTDGDTPASCADAVDGERCGSGRICLDEACLLSLCGDGVLDDRTEECDEDSSECVDCMRQDCVGDQCIDAGPTCPADQMWEGDQCVPLAQPCIQDSLRCAGDAQRKRERCEAGDWVDGPGCDVGLRCDGPSGQCLSIAEGCSGMQPGDALCVGRDHISCGADLTTATVEKCKTPQHCTHSGCLDCIAGEYACAGDLLQLCNDATASFEMYDMCSSGECNAALGSCTDQLCVPSEYSCVDGSLNLCNADGSAYATTTDCSSYICDVANGQCDACVPNTEICRDGGTRSVCDGDGQQWTDSVCASLGDTPVCIDGGRCVACSVNDTRCEDASSARSCLIDNTWSSPVPCVDQTCQADACSGSCAPGQGTCSGQQLTPCGPDGEWGTPTDCAVLCQQEPDGSAGCVICAPGETRCINDMLQRCTPPQTGFGDVTQCGAGLCDADSGGCADQVCNPDEVACAGNLLTTCNATGSALLSTLDCDTVSGTCDALGNGGGGQCDVCSPDEVLGCASDSEQEVCSPDGQGPLSRSCPNGQPVCTGSGECVQCLVTDQLCEPDGTGYRVCGVDQTWGTPVACIGQTCVGTSCQGSCEPGQVRCDGQNRQDCDAVGDWNTLQTCPVLCSESVGTTRCIACQDKEYRCSGAILETCNAGQTGWTQANDCGSPALCDAPNKVCIDQMCTANTVSCQGDWLSTCNATGSNFSDQIDCGTGLCNAAGDRCNTCLLGQHRCSGALLEHCNDTQTGWTLDSTCDSPSLCDAANQICIPATCSANSVTCVGDLLSTCNSDGTSYAEQQSCGADLCNQAQQRCDACAPAEHRCNGSTLEECNGSHTAFAFDALCDSAALCDAQGGSCIPQICTPNAVTCEGDLLTTCNGTGSAYQNQLSCGPGLCDASGNGGAGECDLCSPNQPVSCNGNAARFVCSGNGQSQSVQSCPSSDPVCIGSGNCVECANGTTLCEGTGQYRLCVNNSWSAPMGCGNQTCVGTGVGSACQGNCAPGQSRCSGDTRQTCSGTGWWQNADTCGAGTPFCQDESGPSARCVTCLDGDFNCTAAGWLQRCNPTQDGWMNDTDCGSASLCDVSGACLPQVCTPNAVACLNSSQTGTGRYLTRCNSDGSAYLSPQQCSSAALCDASGNGGSGECDVCPANSVMGCWNGSQQQVCNSTGQGSGPVTCASAEPICIGSGTCVECEPNTATCHNENEREVCDGGGNPSIEYCHDAEQTCQFGQGNADNSQSCGGVCASGSFYCDSGGDSVECDADGTWRSPVSCGSSQRCEFDQASTDYGQCIANPDELVGKNDTNGPFLNLVDDSLYVTPVILPWDANLVELGIRTTDTSNGGRVYLALYADNGGEPGARINETLEVVLLQDNENAASPRLTTSSSLMLSANTKYWLAAYTNTAGGTPRVHREGADTAGDYRYVDMNGYFTPFDPIGTGWTAAQTGRLSLWMRVSRR